MVGELILRCLHARTNAHELHLLSPTYAKHIALNEFYESITDPVDSIAETYQGIHGVIESYPPRYTPVDDPVALINGLATWVEDNRYECCDAEETCLQNIIDEIIALCRASAYKLKVLK